MTLRLLNVAISEWWRFNGWVRTRGVDPLKLYPTDLLDIIYFWLVENADEKTADKLTVQLFMPPAGAEAEDDHPFFSPEAEMALYDGVK